MNPIENEWNSLKRSVQKVYWNMAKHKCRDIAYFNRENAKKYACCDSY